MDVPAGVEPRHPASAGRTGADIQPGSATRTRERTPAALVEAQRVWRTSRQRPGPSMVIGVLLPAGRVVVRIGVYGWPVRLRWCKVRRRLNRALACDLCLGGACDVAIPSARGREHSQCIAQRPPRTSSDAGAQSKGRPPRARAPSRLVRERKTGLPVDGESPTGIQVSKRGNRRSGHAAKDLSTEGHLNWLTVEK